MSHPVTIEEFSRLLAENFSIPLSQPVAVAVSGGPDSMALVKMLSLWATQQKKPPVIHALTVDHGLRAESATEAKQVHSWLKGWPQLCHTVLRWKGRKPKTRIMESARAARYDLMTEYCRAQGIRHLFLAHHQDDQAETFLLRLAKGSGLDGLSSIRPLQPQDDILLLRPFLGVPKQTLVETCKYHKIPCVKDPSNKALQYARPRLRQARAILEEEGLTAKRLSVTAMRLNRARIALDEITDNAYESMYLEKNPKRIVLDFESLRKQPAEIVMRVVIRCIQFLQPGEDYLPRMERIEDILTDMLNAAPFRKRTLGGLVFERNDKKARFQISIEKPGPVG